MKTALAAIVLLAAGSFAASAQDTSPFAPSSGASAEGGSVGDLVNQGFEIKAAVPNGAKYVVFLQKEKDAYACEFTTLSKSRCGQIK